MESVLGAPRVAGDHSGQVGKGVSANPEALGVYIDSASCEPPVGQGRLVALEVLSIITLPNGRPGPSSTPRPCFLSVAQQESGGARL